MRGKIWMKRNICIENQDIPKELGTNYKTKTSVRCGGTCRLSQHLRGWCRRIVMSFRIPMSSVSSLRYAVSSRPAGLQSDTLPRTAPQKKNKPKNSCHLQVNTFGLLKKITAVIGAWWQMPVIPALVRLRQEDCHVFEASLGHIMSSRPAWTM